MSHSFLPSLPPSPACFLTLHPGLGLLRWRSARPLLLLPLLLVGCGRAVVVGDGADERLGRLAARAAEGHGVAAALGAAVALAGVATATALLDALKRKKV